MELANLAALFDELKGKKFCVSPPIRGQEGGALYRAVRMGAGGLNIIRMADKEEVWIDGKEIEHFQCELPPAEKWDGTLVLKRVLAVGSHGVAFAVR